MDEKKRPVLSSAETLKGRKAKPKRKSRHWLVLLLCAVIVAGGFGIYYGTDLLAPDQQEETIDQTPEYVQVPLIEKEAKDVQSVTVLKAGEAPYTIISNIQYDEEGKRVVADATEDLAPDYSVEEMPYFALDTSPVASMMNYAKALTAQHTIEENAADVSPYGLDAPELRIEFGYKDGSKKVILMGSNAPMGTYTYAMVEGDKNVYILYSSVKTAFSRPLNAMHVVKNPVQMDEASIIQNLIFEQKGKETIEMKKLEEGVEAMGISTLQIVRPIVYDTHSTRAQEVITSVIALTSNGYAGHFEDAEGAAGFGLEAPNMRIYIENVDGVRNDIRIGNKTEDGNYYVALDDSGDVYTMSQAALAFTANISVGHLVDQFTNIINIQKVDEITVEAGAGKYTLHIENSPDPEDESKVVSTYFFDGEERDEKSFKKIYQEIIGLLLDRMSEDYHIDGNVVAKATYKFNDGRPDFTVEYLEYDRDYYAIRRDDQTLFLIKHAKVQKMIDSLEQYRLGTYEYGA